MMWVVGALKVSIENLKTGNYAWYKLRMKATELNWEKQKWSLHVYWGKYRKFSDTKITLKKG